MWLSCLSLYNVGISDIAALTFQLYTLPMKYPDFLHFTVSPFLQELLTLMTSYTTPDADDRLIKMNIFSAHDTSLLHIASALSICDSWPEYAAYIAIELHKEVEGDGGYYVRVCKSFKGEELSMDEAEALCGTDGELVPWSVFQVRMKIILRTSESEDQSCL